MPRDGIGAERDVVVSIELRPVESDNQLGPHADHEPDPRGEQRLELHAHVTKQPVERSSCFTPLRASMWAIAA